MRIHRSMTTARIVGATLLLATVSACDAVFNVNNPNHLAQDDLNRPEAAAALVNGTEAALTRGLGRLILPLSVAGDELQSIGSLDFGLQIDRGGLSNPANGVTNAAFPFVAEARFMADEAITRLEGFAGDGTLRDPALLARAYLYGGIVYTAIADAYDDFVISDRREAAPPVGEENMYGLYDRAIEYLESGIAVARTAGAGELEVALLAQRARTGHARAVWELLNPAGSTPERPLVADEAAVANAESALARLPSPDWRFELGYSAGTVGSSLGSQVNVRQEYRIADVYGVPTADNRRVERIRLTDPVEGVPDAALEESVEAFAAAGQYPPLTVVSARELHLILAEAALGRGDGAEAATRLDRVRALTGRAPYGGELPLVELLRHERRVNLFLQGRRLADHYRFADPAPAWQPSSDAIGTPGTFFPIAQVERLSNCHLAGGCG